MLKCDISAPLIWNQAIAEPQAMVGAQRLRNRCMAPSTPSHHCEHVAPHTAAMAHKQCDALALPSPSKADAEPNAAERL